MELDRSQITQMSLNGSLRKSLSNASSYYQEISNNINVNSFNFPSSNSLRGRYGSFNELINVKISSSFEPNSEKNPKSNNQRNNEDLYEIAENSAEITDIASSRIDSDLSTLNNLKDSLEYNNNTDLNTNCNKINFDNLNNNIKINNNNNNSDLNNSNLLINLSSGHNSLLLNSDIKTETDNLNFAKKLDTYDTLFNSLLNWDNFNYRFEELEDKNNYIRKDNQNYRNLVSNNAELNNFDDIIRGDNNGNSNNKTLKTVDVLTREFMNRKMKTLPLNKKDMKDSKLSSLKKIMQSQQKNNY